MAARITLVDFCKQNGYNAVSKVRTNANGYKYVTLADTTTSTVENLYLGTRYSETVEEGVVLPIRELFVTETENAEGEKRWKLTDRSSEMSAEKLVDYQMI